MSFRIVSYWAGAAYERHAKVLEATARAAGVPITVYAAEDAGDWQRNTLMKPDFILKAMEEHPKDDIVWCDADCSVLQFPELFNTLDGMNVAIFAEAEGTNGSVSFFRNNQAARQILKLWQQENVASDHEPDDRNLFNVLKRHGMGRVHFLDPAYCWNEGIMRSRYPGAQPVIEMHLVHMLAGK